MIENRYVSSGAHPRARIPMDFNVRGNPFASKAQMTVSLDADANKPSSAYIHSFSTLDEISGTAVIVPRQEISFDDLSIDMLGTTKTYVDKMTTMSTMHGRTEATHRFLKLTMPIQTSVLPADRKLQKGVEYKVPFTFVVPAHLLPKSCVHSCANDQVKDLHLQLPTSMGDPELSGFGPHLLDDMAPEMVRITYTIRVRITRIRDDGVEKIVDEVEKKLRIKPAFDEAPPLRVDPNNGEYSLQQEKVLRKGLLKGKLGRLIIEAQQPRSFRLPAKTVGKNDTPVDTLVKIKLRFEPFDTSSKPPKLDQLTSKLKVSTFFSSSPRNDLPARDTTLTDMSQGYITEALTLASRNLAIVQWDSHEPGEAKARCDSVYAPGTPPSLSGSDTEDVDAPAPNSRYYTTQVVVPLILPLGKNFLPTFHSCIASRTYTLNLSVSFASKSLLSSSLSLRVPIQISSEGSITSVEHRRQSAADLWAAEEMHDVFLPRRMTMASLPTSAPDLPPSYGGVEFYAGVQGVSEGRMVAEFARRESQPVMQTTSNFIQSAGAEMRGFMGHMGGC